MAQGEENHVTKLSFALKHSKKRKGRCMLKFNSKLEFQGAMRPNSSSSGGGLVASLPNRALCVQVGGFAPLLTFSRKTRFYLRTLSKTLWANIFLHSAPR